MLSTREAAIGLWSVLALLAGLVYRPTRESLGRLIHAATQWRIVVIVALLVLYTAAFVALLWRFQLWDSSLTKDTLWWLLFGGLALPLGSLQDLSPGFFRAIVRDNLKAVLIVEFIVSEYTLPFWMEALLVPFLVFLGGIQGVASRNEEHRAVARVTGNLVSFIGLAMFAWALIEAISDWRSLVSWHTIQATFLAPALTIVSIPFVFVFMVVASYETAFTSISHTADIARNVRPYAKRRLICVFGLRLFALRRFLRKHGVQLLRIRYIGDVDHLLAGW